ncbi:AAA family ATPase [Lysinibacillus xylanilyticus]|uniref:AAA family ATPase n=1 Tax=Lysinibacillus xylanilyticus TaxID=582475 RepID=UPI003D046A5A
MIKKLNIENFGVYKDFIWDDVMTENYPVKKAEDNGFSTRNVIYGRNYTGKTSLSRIFRSLELHYLPDSFENPRFEFEFDDGEKVTSEEIDFGELSRAGTSKKISVYNSDFRKENLGFFYSETENIQPFGVMGKRNLMLENDINVINNDIINLEKILYGVDKKSGLALKQYKLNQDLNNLERDNNNNLTKIASEIKLNPMIFKLGRSSKKYDKRDLENEIESAMALQMTPEIKSNYENLLIEEAKHLHHQIGNINLQLEKLVEEVNDIVSTFIKPSQVLQELILTEEIIPWVQEGFNIHQSSSECKFCGNEISKERLQQFDKIFNDKSQEYLSNIERVLTKIEDMKYLTKQYKLSLDYTRIYKKFTGIIKEKELQYYSTLKDIFIFLDKVKKTIEFKRQNIYKTDFSFEMFDDSYSKNLTQISNDINEVLSENDILTADFELKQNRARRYMRLSFIQNKLYENNYFAKLSDKKELENEISTLEKQINEFETERGILIEKRKLKEALMSEEQNAINLINDYLSTVKSSSELKLNYLKKEQGEGYFQIFRKGKIAKNLSEGEQTLIAFSYFLAKLSALTEEEKQHHIVFIDDPMSSLDSNHTFNIFSLIDSEISRQNFKQLIISTHSLDFLKYMHKLKGPTNNEKHLLRQFVLEKYSGGNEEYLTRIQVMPSYLRKYTTEFIYLFHQIYRVANEEQNESNYHIFYNFPNDCRKFLESYLFFLWPDSNLSNDQRIQMFFEKIESKNIVSFIGRINNEFSHLENNPERSFFPIDIPEFKNNALIVLSAIKQRHRSQYESFLKSLGLVEKVQEEAITN